MNAVAEIIGILTVAAITPGPNNFIVMNAGAQRGLAAAAAAIAGVLVGSVALYVVIAEAWGEISARMPILAGVSALLSAAYLAWLGVLLFRKRGAAASSALHLASPAAVAGFQFLNPKAWGMMAALAAGTQASMLLLVPLMVVVLASCLTIWAVGGVTLSRYLQEDRTQRWFNRVMGALLIVFAVSLPELRPLSELLPGPSLTP